MIISNDLLTDQAALQNRLKDKGYLFFKQIIPIEPILELRKDITNVLAKHGWIKGGDETMDAIAYRTPVYEGEAKVYFKAHDDIIKLESLYSLAHQTELINLMKLVLGPTAFPHPLSIARITFPKNNETTTPPHQDYANNQGTKNLTAAWIPLSDCPKELGSLSVMESSHKVDEVLPLEFSLGAGFTQAKLDDRLSEFKWVEADFEIGDVVLFPSLTVHKALDNKSENKMRLSVDFRYQLEGEALTENVLAPHFKRFTWDQIYEGWKSDKYQYFWKDKNYVVDEWNEAYHELERTGNDEIRAKLQNYIVNRAKRTAHWKEDQSK